MKTIIYKVDLLRKKFIIQWNVWKKEKDLLLLPTQLIEKIHDPPNTKEHYQSFIRKKNTKPVKKIKNNYSATKNV